MEELILLKKQLFSDGELTREDVGKLREALLDGEMTMEKGEFLFSLKDTVTPDHAAPEFKELFVEAISMLLLEDEISPGEIDEKEAKWLRAKIQNGNSFDELDRALLQNLKKKSINFPSILNYKNAVTIQFEKCLYFTRYLTILAVFGALISAIALFIKGSIIVFDALTEFITNIGSPHYESMLEMFVSSVDVFLFAMVLVIFGVGIYELFITKIDPVLQKVDGRPTWMQISNVDDLKSSLGKVILMVLIVTFFKHSIEVEYGNVNDLLKLGVGIVLIALALFITNKSHHK